MATEQLTKIQIQEDIEYLKHYLFFTEACSTETKDNFEIWKQTRIRVLQKQLKNL